MSVVFCILQLRHVTTYVTQFKAVFFTDSRSLVSLPVASATLLDIVLANPTRACVETLSYSVLELSREHIRDVDTFVLAMTRVLASNDPRLLDIKMEAEEQHEAAQSGNDLRYVFTLHLADFLQDALHETALHAPVHTTVGSANPCLAAALFSASAIKHGLLARTKAPYAFTRQGLQLPGSDQERRRAQVVAIGACLHLSAAGSTMMEQWLEKSDGHASVLTALRALKDKKVIKSVGVALLDNTITSAESKFSRELAAADAWNSLFPES